MTAALGFALWVVFGAMFACGVAIILLVGVEFGADAWRHRR